MKLIIYSYGCILFLGLGGVFSQHGPYGILFSIICGAIGGLFLAHSQREAVRERWEKHK